MKAKIITNSKKYRILIKKGWAWEPETGDYLVAIEEFDDYDDAKAYIVAKYGTSCTIVNETEWRMADASR